MQMAKGGTGDYLLKPLSDSKWQRHLTVVSQVPPYGNYDSITATAGGMLGKPDVAEVHDRKDAVQKDFIF